MNDQGLSPKDGRIEVGIIEGWAPLDTDQNMTRISNRKISSGVRIDEKKKEVNIQGTKNELANTTIHNDTIIKRTNCCTTFVLISMIFIAGGILFQQCSICLNK